MIETVPLDVPSLFAIGGLICLASRRLSRDQDLEPYRGLPLAAAGYGLWFGLAVAYPCFQYPDWMWSYGLPIRQVPTMVWYLVFVALLVFSCWTGFLMTHLMLRRGHPRSAWFVPAVGAASWLAIWALTIDQYERFGTFDQYWRGKAPLMKDLPEVGTMMAITSVAIFGPLVALLVVLLRKGRPLLRMRNPECGMRK